jgi:hypothetical protein
MGKWLKCNQGVGVILTSFFTALLIYIYLNPWAHRKLRDGFSLGFFPAVAIVLSIIFSLILIFDSRRNPRYVCLGLEILAKHCAGSGIHDRDSLWHF